MVLALAGASVVAGSACDRGTALGPPLQTPLTVLAASPTDEGTVAADEPLRFRMSTFVRPDTVNRQSISVTAGTLAMDGTPLAGTVFLEPDYDMVERVVTFRLPAGSTWVPGVRTTVTLPQATSDASTPGLRAINDVGLAQPITLSFTATASPLTPPEVLPTYPYGGYCDYCVAPTSGTGPSKLIEGVSGIFGSSCVAGSCHGAQGSRYVAEGLILATTDGLRTTALSRPAHETLTGPSSVEAPTDPFSFGKDMPNIDPGNPGNSYVMYKMLLDPNAYVAVDSDTKTSDTTFVLPATVEPVGGSLVPDARLYDDLRERFVIGDPMPEGQTSPGYEKLRLIHDWIAAGAQVIDACPDVSACKCTPNSADFTKDIQPIFAQNCALAGCHSTVTGTAEHGLDLSGSPDSYRDRGRRDHMEQLIVKSGDPADSFMVTIISAPYTTPTDPTCMSKSCDDAYGDQMPLGGTPLSACQISNIKLWIKNGAPGPQ